MIRIRKNICNNVIIHYISIFSIVLFCDDLIAAPDDVAIATLIFLRISPSTQANAMGQTYGNTIYNSPLASIYNPASLGFFARNNNFGTSFYKNKVDWLPSFDIAGLWYDASAVALGINFKDYSDIPISIGLGFHKVNLELGETEGFDELNNPIGSFDVFQRSKGSSLSLGVDYYIRASYGYTWKHVESHLLERGAGQEVGVGSTEIDAVDYGFIVELPFITLLEDFVIPLDTYFPEFKIYFDPGMYYSKTNIGGKVSYLDAARPDPIPRTVSVGINLKTGMSYLVHSEEFKLFAFNWSREVDDMPIDRDEAGNTNYRSGLHDIKLWDNVFQGKSNRRVDALKEGYEINLADFFFIRRGRYEDHEGQVFLTTKGWGIDYVQPVKLFLSVRRQN